MDANPPSPDRKAVVSAKRRFNHAGRFNGRVIAIVPADDPGEYWIFEGDSPQSVQAAANEAAGYVRLKRRKIDRGPRRRQ